MQTLFGRKSLKSGMGPTTPMRCWPRTGEATIVEARLLASRLTHEIRFRKITPQNETESIPLSLDQLYRPNNASEIITWRYHVFAIYLLRQQCVIQGISRAIPTTKATRLLCAMSSLGSPINHDSSRY